MKFDKEQGAIVNDDVDEELNELDDAIAEDDV